MHSRSQSRAQYIPTYAAVCTITEATSGNPVDSVCLYPVSSMTATVPGTTVPTVSGFKHRFKFGH